MANIIECDGGCGARSPNGDGSFVANHWMNMIVDRDGKDDWQRYRFCPACEQKLIALPNKRGEYVPTTGFASQILR